MPRNIIKKLPHEINHHGSGIINKQPARKIIVASERIADAVLCSTLFFMERVLFVVFFGFAGEHAAGCHDVLTARGAYGGGDAEAVEVVAECGHRRLIGGFQVNPRNGMETYQVHA